MEKTGRDSIVTDYFYDRTEKLTSISFRDYGDSAVVSKIYRYDARFDRDQEGRTFRIAGYYGQPLNYQRYDTILSTVFYRAANSSKVSHIVTVTRTGSQKYIDSAVFSYGIDGKLETTAHFLCSSGLREPAFLQNYFTWSWDREGNLKVLRQYSDPDEMGNFINMLEYRFEYDGMVNPYPTIEDALLEQYWYTGSSQNISRQTVFSRTSADRYANTCTYNYRMDNRPLEGTFLRGDDSNARVEMQYEYQ